MDTTSSQPHHHPPPPETPSIETLESSIQTLVTNWQRRQRWHLLLLGCCQAQDNQIHTKLAPWRARLAYFLDSLPVHLAAIFLILLDLAFTVLNLSSSLLSCSSNKGNNKNNNLYHWGGIAILSVLSVKVLALALALGGSFLTCPGYVVDGLVVIGALILEVLAEGRGAGLLVVVSLWRVVRVVESAFELSNEAIEAQIKGIVSQFEVLRGENRRLESAVREKDAKIVELQEELARLQNMHALVVM